MPDMGIFRPKDRNEITSGEGTFRQSFYWGLHLREDSSNKTSGWLPEAKKGAQFTGHLQDWECSLALNSSIFPCAKICAATQENTGTDLYDPKLILVEGGTQQAT